MTNGNDPAFARPASKFNVDGDTTHMPPATTGLTKREYFAAMAMQGLLVEAEWQDYMPAMMAARAVRYADALIEALNKDK